MTLLRNDKTMLNLKSMYKITSDNTLSFSQKMTELLLLGAQIFEMELGIISEISDNIYTVKHVISPDNQLQADTTFELKNTYCVHTLASNQATSFHHVANSSIAKHPCYLNFGLESYIGSPLLVEGERYGTINFSSSKNKNRPFNQDELEFIELLSHWIGNEIARDQKIALLQSQQKQMQQQQNLLKEMGKLAGVGAWEVDLVNKTVFWNDVTRKIHEVDDDFVPNLDSGINYYKVGPNRERIKACVENAIISGGHFSGEFEIVTQKGNAKWIATQGRAEVENGKSVRLFGAFQDISSQIFYREELEKRHQELSLALNARSLFLANMSHEIRTPINGVLGMLQVMETANFDHNQHRFLSLAKESAKSLLALINDILDFAKVDSGQLNLENIPFNLNQLLENCVNVFKFSTEEKSIKLESQFEATKDLIVVADPTRIRQICANLVSNAIKFTPAGKVKISSALKPINTHQAKLTITVVDSGIGIAEEQLKNLFLPFRQADISTTRKYGGTGLGLSICQNLAKLMNGQVLVESVIGQGSRFNVEIELSLADESAISAPSTPELNKPSDLSYLRILVVEDNEINQVVIGEMLRQRQIQHDIASDGVEALEILQHEAQHDRFYSLILMDCQMPNLDGYQATEQIRRLTPPLSTIPIIALTANAMAGEKDKCLGHGMNDYLSKPLDQNLLYTVIERFA